MENRKRVAGTTLTQQAQRLDSQIDSIVLQKPRHCLGLGGIADLAIELLEVVPGGATEFVSRHLSGT